MPICLVHQLTTICQHTAHLGGHAVVLQSGSSRCLKSLKSHRRNERNDQLNEASALTMLEYGVIHQCQKGRTNGGWLLRHPYTSFFLCFRSHLQKNVVHIEKPSNITYWWTCFISNLFVFSSYVSCIANGSASAWKGKMKPSEPRRRWPGHQKPLAGFGFLEENGQTTRERTWNDCCVASIYVHTRNISTAQGGGGSFQR